LDLSVTVTVTVTVAVDADRVVDHQVAADLPVGITQGGRPLRSSCTQPVLRAVFSKVDKLALFMAWFLPTPPIRQAAAVPRCGDLQGWRSRAGTVPAPAR
jgi:hypothetical protein